jgi:V8-like Glu-specific endopeptidase
VGTTFSNRVVAIIAGLAIAAAVPALGSRPGIAAADPGTSQQAVGTAAQAAAARYWTDRRMTRDLVRQPARALSSWLNGDTGGAGLRWTHGGAVAAAVGRVFFTLGGADYVCSGALVDSADPDSADADSAGPGVVLTAAHCVSGVPGRGRATQWATNWVFVPGFADGRLPYGEYTAHRFLVAPGWTAPGGGEQDDVAFVQVTPVTRDGGAGAAKRQGRWPHGLPVEFARSQDVTALTRSYVFGYPAEPPYAGLYAAYCAGRVAASGGSVRMPCGMTAGDSGGPWLAGFSPRSGSGHVAAVTTYKMSGDLAVLYGTVLGPQARALYQRAVRSAR